MNKETESKAINGNSLLLSLEGFIKYIEGLNKGIQSAASVNPQVVTECIGEVLEYMVIMKKDLRAVLLTCEDILNHNEDLEKKLEMYEQTISDLEAENAELDVALAKLRAETAKE